MKHSILIFLTALIITQNLFCFHIEHDPLDLKPFPNRISAYPILDYHVPLSSSSLSAATFLSHSLVVASFKNQFLLPELMEKSFSLQYHYRENLFSAGVYHDGYSKYGEMVLSGGYARSFARKFAFGMQFYYLMSHAFQYPLQHSFTFDLSFQALINERLGFGVMVYNPAMLKYGVTGEQVIPMLIRLNGFFKMSDKLIFSGTIEKSLPGNFDASFAIGYLIRNLFLSGEVSLTHLSFRTQLRWRSFAFEIESQYHYRLGFSPALFLYYLF